MITRPMRACTAPPNSGLTFPLLLSGKLDGIRCLYPSKERGPVSRNFKSSLNRHITKTLKKIAPVGIDGEVILLGQQFNDTQSAVLTQAGKPDFEYHIFDYVHRGHLHEPFSKRINRLYYKGLDSRIVIIKQYEVKNIKELKTAIKMFYRDGYEGVILRDPEGVYKCGKVTVNEGIIFKIKQFKTITGKIVGFKELMHNTNDVELDEFGGTKRSKHQAGMMKGNMLGSFEVVFYNKKLDRTVTFNLGTGLDIPQRISYWKRRKKLIGTDVEYTYQVFGTKIRPRFPSFDRLIK
jgi:DNA ligase-1